MNSWKSAYEARTDLQAYGDNALGLFALALKFGIDDLHGIAADAITDGSDDKKLDIVHIDEEDEYAVIAQCYFSSKEKDKAPSNKASDLNTGVGWLIQRDIDEVPDRIKSAAVNFRKGIKDKKIKKVYVWYIHNLPESTNVENELITVHQGALTALRSTFPDSNVSVSYCEVGQNCISDWYEECQTPILVNETISLECKSGYEIAGSHWESYSTAISARSLHRLYKKYKTKIFSANIRDYLGSRSTNSNINNGIKNTVERESENFWVYNNGLTILTHDYTPSDGKVTVNGFSIVNGAQTTGAVGSLKRLPASDAMVQARFIAVSNETPDLIQKIIQFNNSQNKVEAADFRSTDKIQKRIKEEMRQIPEAEYEGGRRGGSGDAIRRKPFLLSSYAVGQALAAFHGDPITAYNKKSGIWISDNLYSMYFNENTKAAHIVCVYSLVRAVEEKKKTLVSKTGLTDAEKKSLEFFRKRGSVYLFTYAVSSCLEVFLNRAVPNLFRVSFGSSCSPTKAKENWDPVINVLMSFCTQLDSAVDGGLRNKKDIDSAVDNLKALVNATRDYNRLIYESFKNKIKAP